ncbi:MAG: DUF1919 domain-containing protein [Spirochaetota bacterium]|nr:DUF1919 domain-containing protein [Spirochaetota bacterium]
MKKYSKLLKYIYYIFLLLLPVFTMILAIIINPSFDSKNNLLLITSLLLLWALLSFSIIKYLYLKFIIKITQYIITHYLSKVTFISQDCSGSGLYKCLNLKYLSPFIGILFEGTVYNNFLKDLRFHLSQPIIFIPRAKTLTLKKENEHILADYPVFQLGNPDMEIHWIHSDNEEDIKNKWNSRKERINYERIITINAPEKYKNKFFRNIQISDEEIKIIKDNKEFTFSTRKFSPDNEKRWEYHFEQIKIISKSLKILLLLI